MKRKNELNSIKYKRYQTAFEQIKNIILNILFNK